MSLVLLLVTLVSTAIGAFGFSRAVLVRVEERAVAHERITLEEVLRDPLLCCALFTSFGLVFSTLTSVWMAPVSLVLALVLARKAPKLLERRSRRAFRVACEGQLDVMSDIVAMGMRAGLSFDGALVLYCEKFSGELAGVMSDACLRWQSGMATRERALQDAAERVGSRGLKRFSDTVIQAMRYGSPLAGMLTTLADDIRRERFAQVERQVEKVPVKMLVPTGTCILPAMLVLIMGPVLIQFVGSSF